MERIEGRLESRRGGGDEGQVQWRGWKSDWKVGEVEWTKGRCSGEEGRQAGGKER